MALFRDGNCPPLRQWPEPAQIAGFAGCALFINMVIGTLILPLGFTDAGEFQSQVEEDYGILFGFFAITVFAPLSETFIGQMIPLGVGRLLRRTPFTQIAWSSVWFSLLHIPNGPAHVLQTFGIGWVLATCFLFGWRESWLKAYRMTFFAHALHNFMVFTMFLLSYSLD